MILATKNAAFSDIRVDFLPQIDCPGCSVIDSVIRSFLFIFHEWKSHFLLLKNILRMILQCPLAGHHADATKDPTQ
jgi:hypothetical protein